MNATTTTDPSSFSSIVFGAPITEFSGRSQFPNKTSSRTFAPDKADFSFQSVRPFRAWPIVRQCERISQFHPRGSFAAPFQVLLNGRFKFIVTHDGWA